MRSRISENDTIFCMEEAYQELYNSCLSELCNTRASSLHSMSFGVFRKDGVRITEERLQTLKALNERQDLYERLAEALGKETN